MQQGSIEFTCLRRNNYCYHLNICAWRRYPSIVMFIYIALLHERIYYLRWVGDLDRKANNRVILPSHHQ